MPIIAAPLFVVLVLLLVALVDVASWVLYRLGLVYVRCKDCHDLVAKGVAVAAKVLERDAYLCPRCSGRIHGINL